MRETFHTRSEHETQAIGRKLGESLSEARLILLFGDLGAGKTVFTRGIAGGLGVTDSTLVHSPTFSLVHEYPGSTGPIYHIDLYRLDTLQDLYSIGLEEILESDRTVIIEWAEKLKLRVNRPIIVKLTAGSDPDQRQIEIDWGV